MAAEYITKTHKHKDKETGEVKEVSIKYRIDADFKPKGIGDISLEFIENYVDAHNESEWLLEELEKTEEHKHKDKKNKKEIVDITEEPLSFMTMRKDFAMKFFPRIIKGKPKTESWADRMRRKYS